MKHQVVPTTPLRATVWSGFSFYAASIRAEEGLDDQYECAKKQRDSNTYLYNH